MKSMVIAYDNRRSIGKEGGRPWANGKMRADMKRFRDLTRGKTIIMGRRTFWEDIGGRALPGRQNIVLTRGELNEPDVQAAGSLAKAYAMATRDIVIIGGARVYDEALKDVDVIYATEMHGDIQGDAFFMPLTKGEWRETERQEFPSDEDNIFPYSFVTFERI
jgi:dihydrofolate reductase